jgi:hypothetical protein
VFFKLATLDVDSPITIPLRGFFYVLKDKNRTKKSREKERREEMGCREERREGD